MEAIFETASGSVIGRDHVQAGRNNQDARCVLSGGRSAMVIVVCDGSSSGENTEVGAHMGSRIIGTSLFVSLNNSRPIEASLERARQDVLAQIRLMALSMGGSLSQIVNDYFLFTVMVAVLTPWRTHIASIGDGAYACNGELTLIGPFPNNAPPYLAYAITGSTLVDDSPEALRFSKHLDIETEAVETLLVGTDGVKDLDAASERKLPGKDKLVGPVSQFWEEDRFFKNPFIMGRRLNQISPAKPIMRVRDGQMERFEGHLLDDTTLVVVRRKKLEA